MNEQGEKLQQVKDLLAAESEADIDGSQDAGEPVGQDQEDHDDGGDGPQPSELDEQESIEPEGVEDDAEADETDDAAVALKDIAERLNLDAADLYDVEVPLGKGESTTLGELKDAFKEYGPIQEAKEQLDKQRDEYERSIMQTRAELNGILAVIPPELRQSVIENGRQYNTQWETTQREQVLEVIPEWKDPDKLAKDRDAIVSVGAEYGFSEPEMQYTNDARTLRMLRDFTRLKAEVAEMKTAAKTKRKAPTAPGKQNTRRLTQRRLKDALANAKSSTDMREKRKAVSYLMQSN